MTEVEKLSELEKLFIEYLIEGSFLMVDIGSNGGITCNPGKKLYKCNGVRYMYCDPRDNLNDDEECVVEKGKDIIISKAISDRKNIRKFFLTEKGQVSSLQEPNIEEIMKFDNPKRFQVKEVIDIPCTTLEQVMDEYQEEIDYLKIDVQGHEKYIIDSSEKILASIAPWIMIEMNNKDYYHGQENFWALGRKLELLGYETIDIFPKFNRYGTMKVENGQCRVFTFADVLWRKKNPAQSKKSIQKEIAKYVAFGKLFTQECRILIEKLGDPITREFMVRLSKYYESGLAEKRSEYIV